MKPGTEGAGRTFASLHPPTHFKALGVSTGRTRPSNHPRQIAKRSAFVKRRRRRFRSTALILQIVMERWWMKQRGTMSAGR